jgi:N-acetylglucosaminyldiphosphoundecaprenol N-acetyl-beta-D-mannosaminyltransferase
MIATIGAAFGFNAGNVPKAPSWIESLGMPWFYRLPKESARLSKRYFKMAPKFIFYSIVDW